MTATSVRAETSVMRITERAVMVGTSVSTVLKLKRTLFTSDHQTFLLLFYVQPSDILVYFKVRHAMGVSIMR